MCTSWMPGEFGGAASVPPARPPRVRPLAGRTRGRRSWLPLPPPGPCDLHRRNRDRRHGYRPGPPWSSPGCPQLRPGLAAPRRPAGSALHHLRDRPPRPGRQRRQQRAHRPAGGPTTSPPSSTSPALTRSCSATPTADSSFLAHALRQPRRRSSSAPDPAGRPRRRRRSRPLEEAVQAGDLDQALALGLRNFLKFPDEAIEEFRQTPFSRPCRASMTPTWAREMRAMDSFGDDLTRFTTLNIPTLLVIGELSPLADRRLPPPAPGLARRPLRRDPRRSPRRLPHRPPRPRRRHHRLRRDLTD
ncbi:hypothetical protein SALBM311S_12128 [Streptomyces alboniger]